MLSKQTLLTMAGAGLLLLGGPVRAQTGYGEQGKSQVDEKAGQVEEGAKGEARTAQQNLKKQEDEAAKQVDQAADSSKQQVDDAAKSGKRQVDDATKAGKQQVDDATKAGQDQVKKAGDEAKKAIPEETPPQHEQNP
jgi:hypothetical protein